VKDPSGEGIAVLLASAQAEDHRVLGLSLTDSRWTLSSVKDLWEARAALARVEAPIVLYDRDFPGATWQEGFDLLSSVRKPVALLLLSNVSDPYLWDEVVHHGGFDILTRPFSREEVTASLLFARTHCTALWP
jgi:DNA-binding response OmpR family regulator